MDSKISKDSSMKKLRDMEEAMNHPDLGDWYSKMQGSRPIKNSIQMYFIDGKFGHRKNQLQQIKKHIVSVGPNLAQKLCTQMILFFWNAPNKVLFS